MKRPSCQSLAHCHPCSACGTQPTKTFSYAPSKFVYKYFTLTLPFSPFPLPSSHPLPISSALAMSSPISTLISADSLLRDPFNSDFPGGFIPWENIEPLFDQLSNPGSEADNDPNSNSDHYFVDLDSGSDKQNQNSPNSGSVSGSGYDNSDRSYAGSPSSEPNQNSTGLGSDDLDQDPIESIINKRKLKRKISNRESAKRSRLKKQEQVEKLRNQVNKLSKEKQERRELLRFLTHHLVLLMNENAWFSSEVIALRWKLMVSNQILRLQQLQREQLINVNVDNNTVSNNNATIPPSANTINIIKILK